MFSRVSITLLNFCFGTVSVYDSFYTIFEYCGLKV